MYKVLNVEFGFLTKSTQCPSTCHSSVWFALFLNIVGGGNEVVRFTFSSFVSDTSHRKVSSRCVVPTSVESI